MGGKKYTQEQVDWIGCNFAAYPTTKTLTAAFNLQFGENRTESSIAQIAIRKCGLKRCSPQRFTEKENAWLIENYSKMKAELLTEKFCAKFRHKCKPRTIIGHCNSILGIQSGRRNFPKGNTPWKVCDIGQEKKWSNGYTLVKISDKKTTRESKDRHDNWKFKHILIWEQNHGEVPKDHMVVFLDGDKENFSIENLACVPLRYFAIMARNKWHGKGEITKTAVKWCGLHFAINDVEEDVK